MNGTLYLIPVALGDTQWPTFLPQGARDIACTLRHFIAENAKTARAELKRIGHPLPLRDIDIQELPEKPSAAQLDRLMSPLLAGQDLGMVSEAGCPGVADPGAVVVAKAHDQQIRVVPLIGPSAILLSLMASGFNGQQFAFHGYLPAREPERSQAIARLEVDSRASHQTQIFIETPYRNDALLAALLKTCKPATRLCVASNLTLADESVVTRRIEHWRSATTQSLHHKPTVFLLSAG